MQGVKKISAILFGLGRQCSIRWTITRSTLVWYWLRCKFNYTFLNTNSSRRSLFCL